MIEIKNLSKAYGKNTVINNLNMTIGNGEIYGFIGRNGAGKTTTMNIIAGLIPKNAGTVAINGQEVTSSNKVTVGYLPEAPALLEYMNAIEYLKYISAASKFHGDVRKRVDELIGLVGLENAAKRRIKTYSRGMKQRVGMAAALFSDHSVVLLDEPTSALDPEGRADVIAIIAKLKALKKTIILSTHILSDVERIADRVGILHGGTIQIENTTENLLKEYSPPGIVFETETLSPELYGKISSFEYIKKVTSDGKVFNVEFYEENEDGNPCGKLLLKYLEDGEYKLVKYNPKIATLEEAYMKVVGTPCN